LSPTATDALQSTSTEVGAPISGSEKFGPDELVVYSLSSGPDSTRVLTAIRNSRLGTGNVVRPYLEQAPVGQIFAPGSRQKSFGSFSDKINCQISFRYAEEFKQTDAVWTRNAKASVPRLVEYTVRVWPVRLNASNYEDARDADGRPAGFQLTSAVAL